jgi:hypothetical protein
MERCEMNLKNNDGKKAVRKKEKLLFVLIVIFLLLTASIGFALWQTGVSITLPKPIFLHAA